MSNKKLIQRRFKPNVVYELRIHGIYPYVGCHCVNKNFLYRSELYASSGNYLAEARNNGCITYQEYRECVELLNVWEFDTKEEAQNFETLKIQELKEKYGDLCKNKALYGNQYSTKGLSHPHSEETRKKIRETHIGKVGTWNKGRIAWNKGKSQSEENKKRISKTKKEKGYHWYTNGVVSILNSTCPEGFYLGRVVFKKVH